MASRKKIRASIEKDNVISYKGYREYPCDLCGFQGAIEVPYVRQYTKGQPVHICKKCGFVHVKRRRSAQAIASSWSKDVYGKAFTRGKYTARIPAVKARQVYVADFADVSIGLKGKYLCDIGAGEGQFLEIARDLYGARVFGIEPSLDNCRLLTKNGFENFNGTIEDYARSVEFPRRKFDVITVMWTLCNCYSPRAMLHAAYQMLRDGGYLVIAEGSRICVPFKKTLRDYFSAIPQDLHCFHFSANALKNLFWISEFEVVNVNRYMDTDYLCVIGRKSKTHHERKFHKEDYRVVRDFFKRWHKESSFYDKQK